MLWGAFPWFTEWGEQTSFPHMGAFGCYDLVAGGFDSLN